MERCGAGGGWGCPAGRRRRRRRRQKEEEGSPAGAAELQRRLREARSELQSTDFWDSQLRTIVKSLRKHLVAGQEAPEPTVEKTLTALENLQLTAPAEPVLEPGSQPPQKEPSSRGGGLQCVCYGLGHFSSCVKARYQLAFLLLLLQGLEIPEDRCYVFDPVFSTLEIEVLHDLGLTVLLENEEGKRCIRDPTVFYMVHCGKGLYNNLLWSNWSAEALSKMVVIGNSFKGIEERVLSKIFQKDYSYIAKVLIATNEEAFPSHQQYLDVFNDTSVHCFPLYKLRDLPQEIWKFQEEPVYPDEDQLEIIRKKP